MRTVDLRRIILKMFGDREFYGYRIHKELLSADINIEITRLYRILNEMMKEGLLEARWERSPLGPRKRVYSLGSKGRKELEYMIMEAIKTIHSFYGQYLTKLPPNTNPIDSLCSVITDELSGQGNIVHIIPKYSPIHERMIYALHDKAPGRKIYLVKPSSVTVKLNLENLLLLDGTYDNIPLKNNFCDLLVVIDLPKKDFLKIALEEWHRVLSQNGRLVIVTPTILTYQHKDPLTIGDFVEKYEHETIEKREMITKEFLQAQLKDLFKEFEERRIVHMTVLQAVACN